MAIERRFVGHKPGDIPAAATANYVGGQPVGLDLAGNVIEVQNSLNNNVVGLALNSTGTRIGNVDPVPSVQQFAGDGTYYFGNGQYDVFDSGDGAPYDVSGGAGDLAVNGVIGAPLFVDALTGLLTVDNTVGVPVQRDGANLIVAILISPPASAGSTARIQTVI